MVEETQSTGTNTDVFSVFQFEESCQEYLPAPSVLVELYDQLIINNGVLPIKWKPQFGKKIHEEKQQPTTTSAPKESQRFPEEVHTSQQEEEKNLTALQIVQNKKPCTMSEDFIKPCMLQACEDVSGKHAIQRLKLIPMSANTVKCRIEDMAEDIEN
ncbi:hypothetical protein QYM36_012911 [Artemia franciscana]|uniref:Uncharacterized protein n=1 Tax=Artemia franciscana TaxID=6661 RepID=A0AA88HXA3_ARTSF|nr:hypothetical protein QYM36_012911 [Artemia franciscana]